MQHHGKAVNWSRPTYVNLYSVRLDTEGFYAEKDKDASNLATSDSLMVRYKSWLSNKKSSSLLLIFNVLPPCRTLLSAASNGLDNSDDIAKSKGSASAI